MNNYIKLCLPDKDIKIAKQFYKLAKKKYEIEKKEDIVMTYTKSDDWHCFKIYLQNPENYPLLNPFLKPKDP